MNVSEYLVSFIEDKGIDHIFGVVGGATLWICKALSQSKKITPVFTNHEQAAAMAADGWARINQKPGIVFTINGPGMTNTITGIAQAWVDSSPIILITGNSNLNSVKFERKNEMRQYGTQDVRTDLLLKPITKKTFLVENAKDAKKIFEEAYNLAISGRPGPVCIEIPINIQSAEVPDNDYENNDKAKTLIDKKTMAEISEIIKSAKRPLILAGQGVRLAGAVEEFNKFIEQYQIPVTNSRMGIDTISSDSKLFVGRAGNHGSRAAHFAIQTCDVLLILGCRLAPNTTGYDVSKFSPQSYKILVEIDNTELNKYQLDINQKIISDLNDFLVSMNEIPPSNICASRKNWIKCCNDWRTRYPIMQSYYYTNPKISTYRVVEEISNQADEGALILSDTGSCCSIVAQVWSVKKEQRLFISGGLSAMGYWVTSMGLAFANKKNKQVICFVGDGSLQMNIHELATIVRYSLPIKIFVISNNGYQFVRMSQAAYGIDPPFGTNNSNGVPIPDIQKIVKAYGIDYSCCNNNSDLHDVVRKAMASQHAHVCEVFVDENQEVCPRLKSVALDDGTFISPQYENLYPFLDEKLLKHELNMAFLMEEK